MTPHIAAPKEAIAENVLMPGDPVRAKYIVENYLDNWQLVSNVRGIGVYTGYYRNKKITIMASGMGIPSMGIYSYELFEFYDVANIIRIGSCGSYDAAIDLYDLILVTESYSESNYAKEQNNSDYKIINSDEVLTNKIVRQLQNEKYFSGKVYCSEAFYNNRNWQTLADAGCLGVEMESFALFHNAQVTGKRAACLLTVSDSLVTGKATSSQERAEEFNKMAEIVLETVVNEL